MSIIQIPPQSHGEDFFDKPDTPLPDAKVEFATPAEGAKFMASFGIPQIP